MLPVRFKAFGSHAQQFAGAALKNGAAGGRDQTASAAEGRPRNN
jgi:hypothetical protein